MKNQMIKRLTCALMSLLMLVSFCSCGETATALEAPANVSVRDGFVYWAEVSGANSYVVSINGAQEEIVSSLKCNIEELMGSLLKEGIPTELHVTVKAKGNQITTLDSPWSAETVSVYTRLKDEAGSESEGYTDPGVLNASKANRYNTQSADLLVAEASELQSSFKDDNYWYYVFYLGDITRVPLEDRQAEHFDGVLERTLSFTYSTVETETISNSAQHATEKCDSWSKELSESIGETTSKDVKVSSSLKGLFGAEVSSGIQKTLEKGFSNSFSGSSGDTWTDSYEKAHEYSETVTTSTEVTFTKSVKPGYYRYILMGTVSVYAVVVYDPATEQAYVTKISDVKASYRDFDYSPDPVFDRSTEFGTLSFDLDMIEAFVEPIEDYGAGIDVPGGYKPPIDEDTVQDGSRDNPYLIAAPEDFIKLREHSEDGTYFALVCDVDFTHKEYLYSPITEFKGIFDGRGYAIKNWTYSGNGAQVGFFAINGGTVKNVIFDNCVIERATNTNGESLQVGVACGSNVGRLINIQIRNCTLKDCTIGELEVNQNGSVVAGLVVGENNSGGSVECCGVVYSTINATAKSQFKQAWAIAGGIAGRNLSSVENCYSRENTINTMAEGSERFFGVQKAKLYACSAGLVGEVRGSGSLKYCIAYYNAISTNAMGGENHQYPAFLVSVNDGAVFNCYGRTSNIKSPELVPEITEPEVTVPVEIEDETLPAEVTDVVVDTVAPEATAEPEVTAEPETTIAPENEAPETEATDQIMMVVHPLVATGTGSSSGVATVEKMLLVNLIGFSKELWMDTDDGAVIIHENMK